VAAGPSLQIQSPNRKRLAEKVKSLLFYVLSGIAAIERLLQSLICCVLFFPEEEENRITLVRSVPLVGSFRDANVSIHA